MNSLSDCVSASVLRSVGNSVKVPIVIFVSNSVSKNIATYIWDSIGKHVFDSVRVPIEVAVMWATQKSVSDPVNVAARQAVLT